MPAAALCHPLPEHRSHAGHGLEQGTEVAPTTEMLGKAPLGELGVTNGAPLGERVAARAPRFDWILQYHGWNNYMTFILNMLLYVFFFFLIGFSICHCQLFFLIFSVVAIYQIRSKQYTTVILHTWWD